MKSKFMKRLLRELIIILTILLVFVAIIIIWYSYDAEGLIAKLQNVNDEVSKMTNNLYGDSVIYDNIVLPEKEDLTGAQRYYYFEQLSEPAQKIYVTIENNIDKLVNGYENIQLPASLEKLAQDSGKEKVAEEFQNAWDAFVKDKCEYFYIESSKVCLTTKITTRGKNTKYEFSIGKGDNSTYLTNMFQDKLDVENAKKQIDKEVDNIIRNATGNNYQKILYVHDWLVDNVKYVSNEKTNASNAYGCIVEKKALCEGYARAFKYIMDRMDIPCILVSGEAYDESNNSEKHAWNYVYINNSWYAIDVTWDDPIIIGNGKVTDAIKYKYFLKGSETMNKDHVTSGRFTENGIEFSYPVLSNTDLR